MKQFIIIFIASLYIAVDAMAWNPAGDCMLTQWGESLNPANVHPEYPRPQMKRSEWLNLNGLWQYAITPKNAAQPKSYDGEILVPFAPQSALSGVGRDVTANDEIWYRRTFRVPSGWKGKRVMLNFGAVDWKAEVWVNGVKVGSHTGGYTPFSFDVTPALVSGENTVAVKVWDPGQTVKHPIGKQHDVAEMIWYTNQSGIWQTVWLEPVSAAHITRLKLTPDIDRKLLSVEAIISAAPDALVEATLIAGDGRKVSAKGYANMPFELPMPEGTVLWSPDTPKLYPLEVKLLSNGKVVDKVDSYTAFRKFSIAKCDNGNVRLMLNDRPLFHFGPLDQGWWPDGLYTAPSDEALRYDLEKTKDWGFNMVRKHIKVEPATWYAHCDSLGLIVWQDMPSIDGFPPAGVWDMPRYKIGPEMEYSKWEKENYYKEWAEIIDFVYNSPAVGVYVPFNEAWGQFDTVKTAEWTKAYDPTRLVNPASGGNNFPAGDILDWHHYPDPVMFARDPDRANVVGEYGGLGLVVPGHRWNNGEVFQYAGFPDSDALCDEYEVQAENLLRLVPQGIGAGVYTQTTDVENEINGLMTYDRKVVKIDEPRIRRINRRIASCLSSASGKGSVHDFIMRTMPASVRVSECDTLGHFALPRPYSVPCVQGIFQDLFYWDTYFTNAGLIADDNLEQARNNIECIAAMIERLGFMPNASRADMAQRSQPPYFAPMVDDYFRATGDTVFVRKMMPVIEREYGFWMTQRIAPDGLNRYGHNADKAYLLSFFRDVSPRIGVNPSGPYSETERLAMGGHLLAEAESGWDFNPRFERRCMDYNPVDLNSLLYLYEVLMSEYTAMDGKTAEAMEWKERAERRKGLMNRLMRDVNGMMRDYDYVNRHLSPIFSAASFMPLWVGLADDSQAKAMVANLGRLEAPNGLYPCEPGPREVACQWDCPNGWSACALTAVEGLDRYGYDADADRLAEKYLRSIEKIYAETGQLWEKYNAEEGSVNVTDEYEMPGDFMGWTAGVYSALLARQK